MASRAPRRVTRRASYCSLALRTKRGQSPAPGMIDLSCASIWQPLQTPSANVDESARNRANCSRKRFVVQDRSSPAAAGAEHVAVAEAAARGDAAKSARAWRPVARSVMCTSMASNPARVNAAAISTWPLTPCSRRIATRGRAPVAMYGAAMSSAGSNVSFGVMPGILFVDSATRLRPPRCRDCRARRCIAWLVCDHARIRSRPLPRRERVLADLSFTRRRALRCGDDVRDIGDRMPWRESPGTPRDRLCAPARARRAPR